MLIPSKSFSKGKHTLTDVRHWSSKSYTRIVLDIDAKVQFQYKLLKPDPKINKPARFYVDLLDSVRNGSLSSVIPIDDGILKEVRVGQNTADVVRVVLDIESIEDYKIFYLNSPHRIVIDVFGTVDKKEAAAKDETPVKRDDKKDSSAITTKKKYDIKKIVIDPGHGGRDPGAVGKKKLKEKDVTLKISKLLKKSLEDKIKAKVVLTRSKDVYVPLDERTAIANTNDADLFVSIHVNASPNRKASGVETYYLNNNPDLEARRVASRENNASLSEMSDVELILRDMLNKDNLQDSIELANHIQKQLAGNLKKNYKDAKSNGVKPALFYVLVNANMPSVLVEVSFVSNPTEEARLRKDKYLKIITDGITKGIIDFIKSSNK